MKSNPVHALFVPALLALGTCGAPEGPILSSFGTTSAEITEGQTVRVTAVLSDADQGPLRSGVKGVLSDGADRIYGTFAATGMPGVLTFDLSWETLHGHRPIAFATDEARSYQAEFVDDFGNKLQRSFTLRLQCNGNPACEGHCTPLGDACAVSKNLQCLSGQCGVGCVVDNRGYLDGTANPKNPCQVCTAAKSKTSFVDAPPYTPCASGLTCSARAECNVPFIRRDFDPQRIASVDSIVAPSPQVRLAVVNRYWGSPPPSMASSFSKDAMLAVSPMPNINALFALDANNIFRTAAGGIDVSMDGGRSFNTLRSASGQTIAVWAASASNLWYSRIGVPPNNVPYLYHSIDGGRTFGEISLTLTDKSAVTQLYGSSANDLYLVSLTGGAYRTVDQGVSFTQLRNFSGGAKAVWASGPNNVYLGSTTGLFRSTDGGATFTKVPAPAQSTHPSAEARSIHGCGPDEVYYASRNEVWRVSGLGATFLIADEVDEIDPYAGWSTVYCYAPGKIVVGGAIYRNRQGGGVILETP